MWVDKMTQKMQMVARAEALPGRVEALPLEPVHFVSGRDMTALPEGMAEIFLGMGCFWGAERLFWQQQGVWVTASGYGGGFTPNPNYEEVCSGRTGHTELVRVVYDPQMVELSVLLTLFWEQHDPTQGMRQGNDRGTQYRSALYTRAQATLTILQESAAAYGARLQGSGLGMVTTEIALLDEFYYAETYHQQYLAKNPDGYCGLRGTGVRCVGDA